MNDLLECCDIKMEETIIFKVSHEEAGYLIGYNGSRVRSLRKRFNCDIDICNLIPRVVYITGKDKVGAYGHIICSLSTMKK